MSRPSQWLFETLITPHPENETSLEMEWEEPSESYYNSPLTEEEWEVESTAKRQWSRNLRDRSRSRSSRPITIKTASLSLVKNRSQQESVLAEYAGQLEVQLTGFPPTPPPPGTELLTHFVTGSDQPSKTQTTIHKTTIRKIVKDAIARMPKTAPGSVIVIEVEGHEDETGDPARFGNVGLKRALAVDKAITAELLKEAKKVSPTNLRNVEIKITSAGPTRPIRSNVTPEGRALNRRVEVRIKTREPVFI